MKNRGRGRRLQAAIACASAVLIVAGCSTVTQGRALSMLNDPFRVGDLLATNGSSGIRSNAPPPNGRVVNTDNGQIDNLSLLSINDIEDYWKSVYSQSLKGSFLPVGKLV
ncbi:MAG: peptidase, partial [Mycobacterium sp.]